MDFLSENGQTIYNDLQKYCKEKLKMFDVDNYELAMLANSFDTYAKAAKVCEQDGYAQTFPNGTAQVRPDYTVMKNEYQNILKHSAKFGLNPADRAKFFKGVEGKKAKKFEGK